MSDLNTPLVNTMHPDTLKVASILNDLETLDWEFRKVHAHAWNEVDNGVPTGLARIAVQSSELRLLREFVEELKQVLSYSTHLQRP